MKQIANNTSQANNAFLQECKRRMYFYPTLIGLALISVFLLEAVG